MAADIGALNLKLTADAAQLTKDLADAQVKIKGFSDKAAGALKGFAGATGSALNTVKMGTDLLKNKFNTTGEALGNLGDIAATIPGPWGAAAGAILSTAGHVVDYLQRDLIRAQQAARAGFLSVASGARTVDQAVSDINMGSLTRALEAMTRARQVSEQFGGAALESAFSSLPNFANFLSFGGNAGAENAEAQSPAGVVRRMREAQEQFRLLMADEGMARVRRDMAGEQATSGLREQARAPVLMHAQRTLSRSLRVDAFDAQAVSVALLTQAWDRFTSQELAPTLPQIAQMGREVERTTEALRRQHEQLSQQRLMEQGRALTEQLRTPLERYNAEQDRLGGLLRAGAITWETYGRAVEQAADQLERADEASRQGAAALMEGGAGAAGAIARFQREGGEGSRSDRLAQINERMRAELERIRISQEEMARSALFQSVLRIVGFQ